MLRKEPPTQSGNFRWKCKFCYGSLPNTHVSSDIRDDLGLRDEGDGWPPVLGPRQAHQHRQQRDSRHHAPLKK